MIEFFKNDLINKVMENYYNSFRLMQDTPDFVPPKVNAKIEKYLARNMQKKLKQVDKEYKRIFKVWAKKQKLKIKEKR